LISEDIIQKIKEQNDIVDIVSESVKLRRAGRNHVGLCPFHHEKSPSFSVSQDKQIYKCFGCGEAGNVITFVMKTKNFPFTEAVKYLGDKANIEIESQNTNSAAIKDKNEKLYKLNTEAARLFFNNLQNNKGIIDYFFRRGLTIKTLRNFGIGYAPQGWKNLINYFKKKGYSELDLLNAGLIVKGKNGSYYDRFINRVIFPVFNYRGRVIGFGGRVLDDSKPKYLNSPETEIFKKGTNLYGLNFAVKSDVNRTLIIVEGYMDCISLHQYGITNVVASLGTALTIEQAKLLKRYADTIIVSYDADTAGQSAALRGIEILKKEGFDLKVLTVPEGKDPDEFIKNNGKEAFVKLIENAIPFIDYKIKMASYDLNLKKQEDVIKYIDKVCEIIVDLDPIEKDVHIRKVSQQIGIKEEVIYDSLNDKTKKNVNKLENMYTKQNFGQKLYLEPAYIKAERNLLKLMLENIDNYNYITEKINSENLLLQSHKKLFNIIVESIEQGDSNLIERIEARCNDVESSKEWINIQQVDVIDSDNYEEIINDYIREIKKSSLEESKKTIMRKIKEYEERGLFEESLSLIKELDIIQKQIMQITSCERR
jgi:DNA primase